MEQIVEQGFAYWPIALNGIKALAVLILGWMAAGIVSRAIRKRINATPEIDPTLGNFIASIIRWALKAVVLIAVLGIFGIQATSLVAMMGAATLAIGLALQGTLSDLAAGFMLVLFRPYKLGQYVDIGGTTGTVKDLNLFITELVTPDNVQIIVPNGQAWGAVITNYSHHETRRVDLVFGIGYSDNTAEAIEILSSLVTAHELCLADPAPEIFVGELGDNSVNIFCRPWVKTDDYWTVFWDLTGQAKEQFDANGISIPFPQRDVHLIPTPQE